MGIRYHAYPLAPEFVDHARSEAFAHISTDRLADAWELDGTVRPEMLHLDKCWSLLQGLTCSFRAGPRPAHRLFRGDVTYSAEGWYEPWVDVLDPSEVAAIAHDLLLIDEDDIAEYLSTHIPDDEDHLRIASTTPGTLPRRCASVNGASSMSSAEPRPPQLSNLSC